MSDPNKALLLMLAAAQQQQQQQQQSQQQQQQKQNGTSTTKRSSNGTTPSTSTASSVSLPNLLNMPSTSAQNSQMIQMAAAFAQLNALASSANMMNKSAAQNPNQAALQSMSQMTPEMMMMWQGMMQAQLMQQMQQAATVLSKQQQQQLQQQMKAAVEQQKKAAVEETLQKMMQAAMKAQSQAKADTVETSKKAVPSTSAGNSASSSSNPVANAATKKMFDNAFVQMVTAQLAQQHKQQTQKKMEQEKKARELAAKQKEKEQKEQNAAKMKQQEQIVKFLMVQQQMQQQLMAKQMEEARASATDLSDPSFAKKSAAAVANAASEMQIRLPLQLGWRRQTCVRSITPAGVRGDVSYFAPCGKKLSTYAEVVRYLGKSGMSFISRDNFSFNTKIVIGEFVAPKEKEDGQEESEKEFVVMSEKDINEKLAKLLALKAPLKVGPTTNGTVVHGKEWIEKKIEEPVKPEEPEEILENLNDDYIDEGFATPMCGTMEEHKSREPNDDLLVHEIRHLPDLPRIQNQCLDTQGFADALMIHEFIQNFGHVLNIDLETAPKLEAICAGLAGDEKHCDEVLQLTQHLLRLVMEFPGIDDKKRGKFGQGPGDLGLDRENYSEVMRLFLKSKGPKGKGPKLSELLESTTFEQLRGEEKASILAFFCDELVCSRNVIGEIEKNLDEISRLKGEKWMRDGKARALKSVQSKKQTAHPVPADVVVEKEKEESDSDSSRPASPVANGPRLRKETSPKEQKEQKDQKDQKEQHPVAKKFTPGLGQCEVLTAEEEAMSVKELESSISELQSEALQINKKIHETSLRIRSFPFGYDRFHRHYWLLAHTPVVMIESIGSGAQNNPACNVYEIAAKDPAPLEGVNVATSSGYVDEDVIACVENLVDEVILMRAKADKKQKRRYRRVDNVMKNGWWTLDSRESLESLRISLHGRGIRERCLHRLLSKPWFLNDLKLGKISIDQIESRIDQDIINKQSWRRVSNAVERLRKRMKMSDVVIPSERDDVKVVKPTVTPIHMPLAQVVKDRQPWTTYDEKSETVEEDVPKEAEIRKSIVDTAFLIDPKFWRPAFSSIVKDEIEEEKSEEVDEKMDIVKTEINGNGEIKQEEVPDDIEKNPNFINWKTYVMEEAKTTSQLMVALQSLESMVAWERSAREALCQICKSMDGDEMLVCDGCETGCHMECFRPAMTKVPAGEWFCPRCREERNGRDLCMFCGKENGILATCQRCAYHMHMDCANDGPTPSSSKDPIPDDFICPHCVEMKSLRFAKRVILRGESEEREIEDAENNQTSTVNSEETTVLRPQPANGAERGTQKAQKRKNPDSPGTNLPTEMIRELCRMMLDEIETQSNAGPFLEPVDLKLVLGYKEVIHKPMDLTTIRNRSERGSYTTPEEFASDIELMFSNCRVFNVDESPVGQAGINLDKFFHKRWKQLKYNFTKRLKRLHRHC